MCLYNLAASESDRLNAALNCYDIESFEYSTKLNSFVIDGKIAYTDKYAIVDKFLSEHVCYCSVYFAEHRSPKSGSDDTIGTPDPDKTFQHVFLVTDIKPVGRESYVVKYEIDLVSVNWFNCIANA